MAAWCQWEFYDLNGVSAVEEGRAGRLVREVTGGRLMNAHANLVQDWVYLVVVEAFGQKQTETIAAVR